jgi:hypothetical protein
LKHIAFLIFVIIVFKIGCIPFDYFGTYLINAPSKLNHISYNDTEKLKNYGHYNIDIAQRNTDEINFRRRQLIWGAITSFFYLLSCIALLTWLVIIFYELYFSKKKVIDSGVGIAISTAYFLHFFIDAVVIQSAFYYSNNGNNDEGVLKFILITLAFSITLKLLKFFNIYRTIQFIASSKKLVNFILSFLFVVEAILWFCASVDVGFREMKL